MHPILGLFLLSAALIAIPYYIALATPTPSYLLGVVILGVLVFLLAIKVVTAETSGRLLHAHELFHAVMMATAFMGLVSGAIVRAITFWYSLNRGHHAFWCLAAVGLIIAAAIPGFVLWQG